MVAPEFFKEFFNLGNFERKADIFSLSRSVIDTLHALVSSESLQVNSKSYQLYKNIALVIAVLLLYLTVASCDLVETPLNEAVMVSIDPLMVEFKCKSDRGKRLKWLTHQNKSKLILFNGYSICKEAESFCSVENEAPGEFYLNLTAIHEAAQTYICQEPGTNKESSADLIIIGRETQCKTVANTSHVIMKCDLEFWGNWAPVLEWSYNGTLITEGVDASIVSNKSVSSTLAVPLSANDCNYTCTARFDIRGKPQWTTSTNIPSYISKSVLAVEGNQEFSHNYEGHISDSASVDFLIGVGLTAIAVGLFIIGISIFMIIYLRKRKTLEEEQKTRMQKTKDKDAKNVRELGLLTV